MGYDPTAPDPGLFVHRTRSEAMALHVDDGLLACESDERAMQILGPRGLGEKRKLKFGRLDKSGTSSVLQVCALLEGFFELEAGDQVVRVAAFALSLQGPSIRRSPA